MKLNKNILMLAMVMSLIFTANAQSDIKLKLNEDGSRFLKFTFLNQVWLRYNQNNPGSLVVGNPSSQSFDIGLRRTRMQFFGQVTDRMFLYTQFGMNNFNYASSVAGNRKLQPFFHDALAEYHVTKSKPLLKLGAGLTICNGLSRFSQPSIGTIMTMDVPVFAQTTVDQTDEFSRKLSVFARGQLGRLDYRLVFSDPFPVSTNGATPPPLGNDATFALKGHRHQYQGFFIWNLLDKEPHATPYMTGTYLGKKRILNLEAGAVFQPNATWSLNNADTAYHAMLHWSLAGFLDMPVNAERGDAISAYLGYFNLNYGPNYIRNNGVMNPANGLNAVNASFNGAGNAFPMFGTGNVLYAQAGYKFKDGLLGEQGTLQPYASTQVAMYEKLDDPMVLTHLGLNWLVAGHAQKFSLDWQTRPVFELQGSQLKATQRKSQIVLQYQTSI